MIETNASIAATRPANADIVLGPRRQFFPAQREPLRLPDETVELPSPPQSPGSPPTINLWTTVLPPAIMVAGSVIAMVLTGGQSLTYMIPMFIMSLGFPAANFIGLISQKKAYYKALAKREQHYHQQLQEARQYLDHLAQQQRSQLERAYPSLPRLERIALSGSKLMWSRRPADEDFLSLRLGTSEGAPSFSVEMPRYGDPSDKLSSLAVSLAGEYERIPNLPAMLHLNDVGSVAISGRPAHVYSLARRLVLDLIVHHSPRDVHLAVLSDQRDAAEHWEWLKWIPHTDALGERDSPRRLALSPVKINEFLEFLVEEYRKRLRAGESLSSDTPNDQPAIVILFDDTGTARQRGAIRTLAERGREVGIYLLFVGGRNWPRECRSRIDLLDGKHFKLTETWTTRSGSLREGDYETAELPVCQRIARKLAGWQDAAHGQRVPLPERVSISQVVGTRALTVEAIKESWSRPFAPGELLQFPIGLCIRHGQLDTATINLLPEELGGDGAYHTILIGTTGSGKSEFMKSLVMGAALRYPPTRLNFFFLDFKGGAAFNVFEELPHVSGVVTNLRPELVERALDSIENEIERRQEEFARVRAQDIWSYNQLPHPDQRVMPHLVLFLDEFTRGLADFPRLRDTLDKLVRLGRSLGMYLILANQNMNSEVDKLLNNVGWRIALKVAKPEEMAIIDRTLRNVTRPGQGYLRSLTGEITEFQAGYAGFRVQGSLSSIRGGFSIHAVEADGSYRQIFSMSSDIESTRGKNATEEEALPTEESQIITALQQAAAALRIRPAERIYLEPLPEVIPLESIFSEDGIEPCYADGKWTSRDSSGRIVAYWGKLDIPEERLQETLTIDFNDRDGHLWIIGAQGSGKDIALASLLMSLVLRYTPEQVQFYLLELGGGELAWFEGLPHIGAVIRPHRDSREEVERLRRLLSLLDKEMEARMRRRLSEQEGSGATEPALFVIINSFAELRGNFPDEAERLTRFVRDGGALGIHFVISTSRGMELVRSISNIISRRLVLQLANRDEYIDIIGRQVSPLTGNIPGRAYWVDGSVTICQVAQSAVSRDTVRAMRDSWQGSVPPPIETLPSCLPMSEFMRRQALEDGQSAIVPVGQSYETLEDIAPALLDSSTTWLVLGPRESGKSNFLACVAMGVLYTEPQNWLIKAYVLRRSAHIGWGSLDERIEVFTVPDDIVKDAESLAVKLREGQDVAGGKHLLLLIDELGAAFQPGKEAVAKAIGEIGQYAEMSTDMCLVASGLLEELRMQIASPMIKFLRQGRTGLVFSQDSGTSDWLGAQLSLEYRKMSFPVGRGFFIDRGKVKLVQTPFLGECDS